MNNDLISKKVLMDKFHATLRYFNMDNKTKIVIEELIECIPTAYDVDKVVEQLEECCDIMRFPVDENCFEEECKYNDCTVCVFEKAIRIVQKGGIEE